MKTVTDNGVKYVIPDQGDTYTWASGNNGVPGVTALLQSLARPATRIDVTNPIYGAIGDGVHDDTAAIQAAINAGMAAGGGVLYFPNTGKVYKITAQLLQGVRMVNESDVSVTALGYPTGSYSSQNATSWSPSAALAATGLAALGWEFEPGAALWWGGTEPATETAMIYVGVVNPAKQGSMTSGYIRGGSFLGPAEYTPGGGFAPVGGLTPVTTNVSGIFVPGVAQITIERCSARGLQRGITTSDNYWGLISQCEVFRCLDGITCFTNNSSIVYDCVVQYGQRNGYVFSGQGYTNFMCSTQQCAVDYNLPTSDNYTFVGGYLENTTATHTDYSIKIGQNGAGVNAVWGQMSGIHMTRHANGKHVLMQSVYGLSWNSCRFDYAGTANRSTINDATCTDIVFNACNIPLDTATLSARLPQCTFIGSVYDVAGVGGNPSHQYQLLRAGTFQAQPAAAISVVSEVADGAGAVAHDLNTTNTLATVGAIHTRGRNNGTPLWWFDYLGGLTTTGTLRTAGSRRKHRGNLSANTTLDTTYEFVFAGTDVATADIVITLPTATSVGVGFEYIIGRNSNVNSTYTVRVQPQPADGVARAAAGDYITLAPSSWVRISSNGANAWDLVEVTAAGEQTVTGSLTLDSTSTSVIANATGGAITVTLPTSSRTLMNRPFNIKKQDASANTVTVSAGGGNFIDGLTTYVLSKQNAHVSLVCNGSDFYVVSDQVPVDGSVTNAKLATAPNGTVKGNVSGSTATPTDLVGYQLRSLTTGQSTNVSSGAGTVTPDYQVAGYYRITATANTITIGAPLNAVDNAVLAIAIVNSSGGALAVTWTSASGFRFTGGNVAPAAPASTKMNVVEFRFNSTAGVWQEQLRSGDV